MKYENKEPFVFNPWKHHMAFICERINYYSALTEESLSLLENELLTIGESQTDFYYGSLTPESIRNEIYSFLLSEEKFEREQYFEWLNSEPLQYKKIRLSDSSKWILRLGIDDKNYIHFHPGRHSVFTIRIKASTLKTAVASIVWSRIYNTSSNDILTVNKSRQILLSLPPVKNLSVNKSIQKIIKLLESENA